MSAKANAEIVCRTIRALPASSARRLIAIAGPPAAGKSTLTDAVRDALERSGTPTGVVPMDGFHFDNAHLTTIGLLHRKGAPETFDLPAFRDLLNRLVHEDTVRVPLFDRENDRTRPDGGIVRPAHRCVLVEGNYLLLDKDGWRDLAPFWALSVFVQDTQAKLEQRLIERWIDHGFDAQSARQRALENDLPNARTVLEHRLPSDLVIGG